MSPELHHCSQILCFFFHLPTQLFPESPALTDSDSSSLSEEMMNYHRERLPSIVLEPTEQSEGEEERARGEGGGSAQEGGGSGDQETGERQEEMER